jgi:hypothetical protein
MMAEQSQHGVREVVPASFCLYETLPEVKLVTNGV